MAKLLLSLPDELSAKLTDHCAKYSYEKSEFIRGLLRTKLFGNDPGNPKVGGIPGDMTQGGTTDDMTVQRVDLVLPEDTKVEKRKNFKIDPKHLVKGTPKKVNIVGGAFDFALGKVPTTATQQHDMTRPTIEELRKKVTNKTKSKYCPHYVTKGGKCEKCTGGIAK